MRWYIGGNHEQQYTKFCQFLSSTEIKMADNPSAYQEAVKPPGGVYQQQHGYGAVPQAGYPPTPPHGGYMPPPHRGYMPPPHRGYMPPPHRGYMPPPHRGYMPPPHGGYMPPPQLDYPSAGQPQAAGPVPTYQYNVTMTQPATQRAVVVGGCPACGVTPAAQQYPTSRIKRQWNQRGQGQVSDQSEEGLSQRGSGQERCPQCQGEGHGQTSQGQGLRGRGRGSKGRGKVQVHRQSGQGELNQGSEHSQQDQQSQGQGQPKQQPKNHPKKKARKGQHRNKVIQTGGSKGERSRWAFKQYDKFLRKFNNPHSEPEGATEARGSQPRMTAASRGGHRECKDMPLHVSAKVESCLSNYSKGINMGSAQWL